MARRNHFARANDRWESCCGGKIDKIAKEGADQLLVPVSCFEVHQQRPRCVGDVGDIRPTGKEVDDPCIDGSKSNIWTLSILVLQVALQVRDMFNEPPHFGRTEIRRERKTGNITESIDAIAAFHFLDNVGSTNVVPN